MNKLRSEGIDKYDLPRDEFLKHAWDWTHEYGGVILEQLKKLGCSLIRIPFSEMYILFYCLCFYSIKNMSFFKNTMML